MYLMAANLHVVEVTMVCLSPINSQTYLVIGVHLYL